MLQATLRAHRSQQRLILATLAVTRKVWGQMGEDFDASWLRVGPKLTVLTAAAQLGAARAGAAYVPDALGEQGIDVDPVGEVDPRALSGAASDGRPLDTLLYGAVIHAKQAQVQSLSERLLSGRQWLDSTVTTQVADASRVASGVSIAASPGIEWTRMVHVPCCKRCAALAGITHRWDVGFKRHPRCLCEAIPSTEAMIGDITTDRDALFESMDQPEQDRIFTKAGAQAIRDGADMSQVVNARRGMHTAAVNSTGWAPKGRMTRQKVYGQDVFTTDEGTTKRGLAGKAGRTGRKVRLMPESIYEIAEDRADALRLLKVHGYLL